MRHTVSPCHLTLCSHTQACKPQGVSFTASALQAVAATAPWSQLAAAREPASWLVGWLSVGVEFRAASMLHVAV
jgi:hypothetical protein